MSRRGGARPGAGRKPGGVNKKTVMAYAQTLEEGTTITRLYTALEFFQAIYRDARNSVTARMQAAAQALPYESAKLAPQAEGGDDAMDRAVQAVKDAAETLDARFSALAQRKRAGGDDEHVVH